VTSPNDEIAALQLEMARLMHGEDDPARQAAGATRLALAAVSMARAHRSISVDVAHDLTDALSRILAELARDGAPGAREDDDEGAGDWPRPSLHRRHRR
jgi:hypothetical protein